MATYPGTVKVFTSKVDQTDTLFAAHINVLQDEVAAIQTTLGVNPQGPVTTVAARMTAAETGVVNTTTDQTVGGNKTFSGVATFTSTVRASSAATLDNAADTDQPWQVGVTSGPNLAVDSQRIQARNNNAPTDLLLQPYGGDAKVGAGKVWTNANSGPASGMDADTVDGLHASAFTLAGHKHVANFTQLYRSTTQSIPDGVWTTVIFNTQVVNYHDSDPPNANSMYTMGDGRFYTPQQVGPALYTFGARFSYESGDNDGTRRIRFLDSNNVVIDQIEETAVLTSKDSISLGGLYFFPGTLNYYVTVQTFQDAGQSRNILANTATRPFTVTWGAIARGLA